MTTKKKTLHMETTSVPVAKTIGEITALLVEAGARAIRTEYDQASPVALSWSMVIYDRPVFFQMPAKVTPVFKYLRSKRSGFVNASQIRNLGEQAARVAWRQLLRWVEVQLALIDVGMVEYAQVFLAYQQEHEGGRTVWDAFKEHQFKALEAPKPQ